MSPNADIEKLAAEGFIVELREGHVVLHEIPYVDTARRIRRGQLVAVYQPNPQPNVFNHPAWFKGDMPCGIDGQPLVGINGHDAKATLGISIKIDRMFSTKPQIGCYAGHYEQLHRYVDLISSPATALDPYVLPTMNEPQRVIVSDDNSVFAYYDTAAVRNQIQIANERFKGMRIGIVGVGGTGSYILDLVSKTCVAEIHLFDEDVFSAHNAFRAPGVARKEEVDSTTSKITFFANRYDAFRKGIVRHEGLITCDNLSSLNGLDFVFISVDDGPSRGLISSYLRDQSIAFIDVGMGLDQNDDNRVFGQCRMTFWHPGDPPPDLPIEPKAAPDLYRSAIQTIETNALSASLAVLRWKRFVGFYHSSDSEAESIFNVSRGSICRS